MAVKRGGAFYGCFTRAVKRGGAFYGNSTVVIQQVVARFTEVLRNFMVGVKCGGHVLRQFYGIFTRAVKRGVALCGGREMRGAFCCSFAVVSRGP